MAPSIDEALGFADVLRKTIGDTDGEWSRETGDNAYHAKLTNHGMRCLLVLAAEVQRLRGGLPHGE